MPEASADVPPKARRLGLIIPLVIALAVFVVIAIASWGRVASVETSGPIAQGAENLVGQGTAQESYSAVTREAPPAGPGVEQPSQTTGGDPGVNP